MVENWTCFFWHCVSFVRLEVWLLIRWSEQWVGWRSAHGNSVMSSFSPESFHALWRFHFAANFDLGDYSLWQSFKFECLKCPCKILPLQIGQDNNIWSNLDSTLHRWADVLTLTSGQSNCEMCEIRMWVRSIIVMIIVGFLCLLRESCYVMIILKQFKTTETVKNWCDGIPKEFQLRNE